MVSKSKIVFIILIIFSVAGFTLVSRSQAQNSEARVDAYQRELPDRSTLTGVSDHTGWLMPPDGDGLQPAGQINASGLYQPYVVYSGSWDSAVGIGDFNHDGLNDVAITDDNGTNGRLGIYLQNAGGTLNPAVVYSTGNYPISLAVGDLNNDQRDDIVVANLFNNRIGVFLQQADGTMAPQVPYVAGTSPDAVAVADLNNDGLKDVVASHLGAYVCVFLQRANGTLGSRICYSAPAAGYDDIDTGDLNHDGLMDVVKMNGDGPNPNLSMYFQNANGNLTGPLSYDLPGSPLSHGVATGDLTGDGLVDLALGHGGNSPNAKLSVLAQTVTGTLQLDATYSAVDVPEPVEIADVNIDGRLDVLVVHGGWNRVSIFLQQPDGTLSAYLTDNIPYASHYVTQGFDVGDINNDWLPDIVIADYNHGLVILYHVSGSDYPTPTPTATFTPRPTSTATPTFTPTPTDTFTPTPSPTATPTFTPTPTDTFTPTPSPTATPTYTPTPTNTYTPTPSPTSTPTFTLTPTPSSTATPTSMPTETFTPTPSSTATPTLTPTPTNTPGCVPIEGPVIYWNNFEDSAGAEWSYRPMAVSPNGQRFLGQFGNSNTRLAISCLPAHQALRVSVDLYVIRSWDGNDGSSGGLPLAPDLWGVGASNFTILMTTFSNWLGDYQAYPMAYPDGNNLAFTGVSEINALGYEFFGIPMDAIYHLSFLLPHRADLLELDFSAMGLQSLEDESWGIDNVEVLTADFDATIYLPMIVH